MIERKKWKSNQHSWLRGQGSDETVLKSTTKYLRVSGDWADVKKWLIRMGFSKRQALTWFAENDFTEFSAAVKESWPAELEDV